jgi:hypothetical protein
MEVSAEMPFQLYLSEDRCTKVEVWEDGVVRVVTFPFGDPELIPDKPIVVSPEATSRVGRREE